MYNLRPYQADAKNLIYQKIREGKRRILYWLPTGGGKGMAMSDFAKDATTKGAQCLTVMRRRELIFQTKSNYEKYHAHTVSIIMGASKGYMFGHFIQVCSIDTIRTRMLMDAYQYLARFKIILVDECHDSNSPTYQRFFDWVIAAGNDPIFIGFTATPFTIGGKALDFWQDYVNTITPQQMRDEGWLVPDVTFAPLSKIDTLGLKLECGDFKEKDLFDRAQDSVLVGDIVKTWQEKGQDRPTLLFCVNKEHSKLMAAAFNRQGIPTMHIDESTTSAERADAIAKLKTGALKVLSNINTLTTGVDAPCVGTIILARPTWSEVLYIQTVGRGARPFKICADCGFEYGGDKACLKCKSIATSFEKLDYIILDHAGNIGRHGLPYDERKPKLKLKMSEQELKNLSGAGYRNNPPPIKTCDNCFAVYSPSRLCCPQCQHANKVEHLPDTEKGELSLIDEATAKKLKLNQYLSAYKALKVRSDLYNWKPNAIWFNLHKRCGDGIFAFKSELGLPSWLEPVIIKKQWDNLDEKN